MPETHVWPEDTEEYFDAVLPAQSQIVSEFASSRMLKLAARDSTIRRAFAFGYSQARLATLTGLTRQRVQQICGKDETS